MDKHNISLEEKSANYLDMVYKIGVSTLNTIKYCSAINKVNSKELTLLLTNIQVNDIRIPFSGGLLLVFEEGLPRRFITAFGELGIIFKKNQITQNNKLFTSLLPMLVRALGLKIAIEKQRTSEVACRDIYIVTKDIDGNILPDILFKNNKVVFNDDLLEHLSIGKIKKIVKPLTSDLFVDINNSIDSLNKINKNKNKIFIQDTRNLKYNLTRIDFVGAIDYIYNNYGIRMDSCSQIPYVIDDIYFYNGQVENVGYRFIYLLFSIGEIDHSLRNIDGEDYLKNIMGQYKHVINEFLSIHREQLYLIIKSDLYDSCNSWPELTNAYNSYILFNQDKLNNVDYVLVKHEQDISTGLVHRPFTLYRTSSQYDLYNESRSDNTCSTIEEPIKAKSNVSSCH